jgi:hypothetical protein
MRILLIAPDFYDYHNQIVQALVAEGHMVRFFAERPWRPIYSPTKKLPARLRQMVFDRYLSYILSQTKAEVFDRVIVIRGEILEPWFITELRARHPEARFVLYEWDSWRVTDFRPLVPLFDAVASFDSVDALDLGLNYLPLFFVPAYRIKETASTPEWDLVFVGSYHEARYRAMLEIREACAIEGLQLRHHLYIARVDYLKLRLFTKFCPRREDVSFTKLDQTTVVSMYRNAAGILDIENNKQTGLTMRSFEALATGRYLVTTNPLARKLVPELASRILELDRNALHIPAVTLKTPLRWGGELDRYSLQTWLGHLLAL